MEEDILIFVDGELYKGTVVYSPYKGIGWPSGRLHSIILVKDKAARYQDVSIVYLNYGKMRRCKYNDQSLDLKSQLKLDRTVWDVIDMPGDY